MSLLPHEKSVSRSHAASVSTADHVWASESALACPGAPSSTVVAASGGAARARRGRRRQSRQKCDKLAARVLVVGGGIASGAVGVPLAQVGATGIRVRKWVDCQRDDACGTRGAWYLWAMDACVPSHVGGHQYDITGVMPADTALVSELRYDDDPAENCRLRPDCSKVTSRPLRLLPVLAKNAVRAGCRSWSRPARTRPW